MISKKSLQLPRPEDLKSNKPEDIKEYLRQLTEVIDKG